MTRRRRILGWLGYAAFLVACSELALQGFYRTTAGSWLFQRAAVPIWAPNPWSGVFNKPNLAYRHRTHEFDAMNYTNAQGLRVAEGGGDYPLEPPEDATRILLLGPSFAFGWGVDFEATFGHRLERLLGAGGYGGRGRVELVNAGVSSLAPAAHLSWFRGVGRDFRPERVIQLVYGSMTVSNEPRSRDRVTPEGYLVPRGAGSLRRLREQAKKSALVFYAWIVSTRLGSRQEGPAAVAGAGRELELGRAFRLEDPGVAEALDYYRALRDATRDAGAEPLVVYFPLSYAVHPEDASRWRHLGVRDVAAQQAFDRAFCEHLRDAEALPCLDITGDLRRAAASGGERLYYWLDVHWTEAGNRVAAEAVAAHLLAASPAAGAWRRPASPALRASANGCAPEAPGGRAPARGAARCRAPGPG